MSTKNQNKFICWEKKKYLVLLEQIRHLTPERQDPAVVHKGLTDPCDLWVSAKLGSILLIYRP